jgi:pyruvate/2-oxoglutarate dehydrogenase complex dihydrolipoamide dehydrogenase (E3) component
LEKLGVEVKCGVEVSPAAISSANPDVVIEATGAEAVSISIPTEFPEKVMSSWSVLAGQQVPGRRVLVIGGGMVGLETADFLAARGKDVVVIELLDQLGQTITPTARATLLFRLEHEFVEIITGVVLEYWGVDGVVLRRRDGLIRRLEGIENVVVAVGSRPNRVKPPENASFIWKRVGDCEKPRDILADIREAAEVAMAL